MPEKQPNPFGESRIRESVLGALFGLRSKSLNRTWTRHQNWRHLDKTQKSIGKGKGQRGMLRHRQSTKRTTHSSCRKGKSGTASDDGDGRQQHWKNRQNSPTKSRFITFLKTALGLVLTIFPWLEELKKCLGDDSVLLVLPKTLPKMGPRLFRHTMTS